MKACTHNRLQDWLLKFVVDIEPVKLSMGE